MKQLLTLFAALSFSLSFGQTTVIPDATFEQVLIDLGYDTGTPDGSVPTANIDTVTSLDVYFKGISDLTGIEDFTALTFLNCRSNQLASLNVNLNTNLQTLWCNSNQLTSLDVSNNTALIELHCGSNKLMSLDVSNNTILTELWCNSNQLTGLNLSQNIALEYLACSSNSLTVLDVSNNTSMAILSCSSNPIKVLDVSQNTSLEYFSCHTNQLTSLDVSHNTALTELLCTSNQLTSLDVSQNTALTNLLCHTNQLTSLDVSQNTALTSLSCNNNQLTSLDVSQNTALLVLTCQNNQLTSLDVSQNTALVYFYCQQNQLTCLNIKNGNNQNISFNAILNQNLTCVEVDDTVWAAAHWAGGVDLQASFSANCGDTCNNTIIGISENIKTPIQVFPNPFSSSTIISFPDYANESITLSIFDMMGNRVRKDENIHSDKVLVERGNLTKGIYFVELRSADNMYLSKLIVK